MYPRVNCRLILPDPYYTAFSRKARRVKGEISYLDGLSLPADLPS